MNSEIQHLNEDNKSLPLSQKFQIFRIGLPLSFADNVKCGLVLVLTAFLQIRFSKTVLAEGWIIFLGLVGYLLMRYWLLLRRYPEVGEIEITNDSIIFPDCIAPKTVFNLNKEISFIFYFSKSKGRETLSSVEIIQGAQKVKINGFTTDLVKLERAVIARDLPTHRRRSSSLIYAYLVLLIFGVLAAGALWLFIQTFN